MKKHYKMPRADWLGKAILCLALAAIYYFNLLAYLELKLEDKVYQSPGLIDPRIVVIGIDEHSVEQMGPFHEWSRQTMADAINILNSSNEGKPAVIAIDVLYTGDSSNQQGDESLAEAARQGGNVVLASIAYWGKDLHLNSTIEFVETPFPALAQNARYGLANGTLDDRDGVVRTALMRADYGEETVNSFPYEIYSMYSGQPSIPALENDRSMFISYSGYPGDYLWGSFSDIFEEGFDPSFFADSIVLIGPYASAMMDAYYTPISSSAQMYGVEIHANVVQMLLEENFKRRVPTGYDALILTLVLLIALALALVLDVRALFVAYAALIAGFIFLALKLFASGHIVRLLYPLLAVAVLYIYQTVSSYVTESIEKKQVKDTFKKYVDPELADRLLESGETQRDEVGTKRDIAVMFVDIRGFTPMSEALKDHPELVVKILNEYLEHTSTYIFKNGGSVDKFIGDATMGLFNGFVPLEDYIYKAVKAAVDIVKGAEQLNHSLFEKYGVDVGFGVGLHCGEAIVGNLGPSFRKDYTAIGDTVNTAARLEGQSHKSQILISQQVHDALAGRIDTEFIGNILLKGKAEAVPVYAVIGLTEAATSAQAVPLA